MTYEIASMRPYHRASSDEIRKSCLLGLERGRHGHGNRLARHQLGLRSLRFRRLHGRHFATGRLRRSLGSPLGVLVKVILSDGSLRIVHGGVRIMRIRSLDIGKRIGRPLARLLRAQLLGELIGIGGQVLELPGYFLLFCFLTSAAHVTPWHVNVTINSSHKRVPLVMREMVVCLDFYDKSDIFGVLKQAKGDL